jgi:hypothetical protein
MQAVMTMTRACRTRSSLLLVTLTWACTSGGDDSSGLGAADSAPDIAGDDGDGECVPPFGPPQDPTALPACCPDPGGAHCLPTETVDPSYRDSLAACEGGGLCVPDPWIAGETEIASCTSLGDEPGRCLSLCMPEVQENGGLLPQDVCQPDQRCVPCISPLDDMPTGACEIDLACADGVEDDGETEPPPESDCCGGRGTCVPAEAAGDDAESLEQDSCSGEGELCAPNEMIDGDYQAAACESLIGQIGGDPAGACMPDCLADTDIFLEDGCGSGYKCVACELPLLGETGACDYL